MGLKLIDAVGTSNLPRRLRPAAVFYALRADDNGDHCYPGLAALAKFLGCHQRVAALYRNELIQRGILQATVEHRGQRVYTKVDRFEAACLFPLSSSEVNSTLDVIKRSHRCDQAIPLQPITTRRSASTKRSMGTDLVSRSDQVDGSAVVSKIRSPHLRLVANGRGDV